MVLLQRGLAVVSILAVVALTAIGCAGLSEEESKLRCDQERTANVACFDDKAYGKCTSCYEECGDSCVREDTCPVTYKCQ